MDVESVKARSKLGESLGTTVGLWEAYEGYLSHHRIEGHTDDTVKFYAKELRLFLRDLDPPGESLGELSYQHCLKHLGSMVERGLKPRTVSSRWQAISTWLNWCVEGELIESSPAGRISRPKVPKTHKRFLTEQQFYLLLAECPLDNLVGARRQAMIWMMATTGIRRNELCSLTRDDLDWDEHNIRVLRGKGQKERQIPFNQLCQEPMLRYLQHRKDLLNCLWITEAGKRLAYDSIWQDINEVAKRAGIKLQDTCHIFRRTFAARAVKQQIPRPYIKGVAGWSSYHMLDEYVAAMEGEEEAIEAFKDFSPFGK